MMTVGRLSGAAAALGGTGRSMWANRRRRGVGPGAVVLGYHDVCADADEADADPLTVSASRLARHLRLVRALGFEFVTVTELAARLERGAEVDRLCVVTFDDALDGLHRHGLDVLRRLDVPAVVYVVSEALGAPAPWWPEVGPVMTAAQLEELVAAGVEIGSHTRSHRSLIDVEDLDVELVGSRRSLEERVEGSVLTLAYPSGHHDAEVRAAAEDAGYRLGFTFLNGRVTGDEDRYRLPRLTMGRHLDPVRLAYHLLRPAESWPDHQVDRVGAAPAGHPGPR